MFKDRVQETSTTTGTGTLTLAGAVSGYRAFSAAFSVGDTVCYAILQGTVWETGQGVLVTSTTLSRVTVFANSSGTTTPLTLAAGTKNVWCDLTAATFAALATMPSNAVVSRGALGSLQGTSDFTFDPTTGKASVFGLTATNSLGLSTNNTYLTGLDISSITRNLIGIDASNYITVGAASGAYIQMAIGGDDFIVANTFGQILRGGAGVGTPMQLSDGGTGKTVGLFEYNACLNADYSNTAATFQSSNLAFTVQSGEVWDVEFVAVVQAGANTTGIKLGILAPASSTCAGVAIAGNSGASPIISQIAGIVAVGGTTGFISSLALTSGAIAEVRYSVTITCAAAGTIALCSLAGTSGTAVKILAGSKMNAKRSVKV